MSATVITLGGALAVPNGIKIQTDVLDYPQTLIIEDWARQKTYPAQTNPVPIGTEFINSAKSGALISEGFVAESGTIGFSAANKSISLGSNTGRLKFGAAAAPYPLLGIGGQTTDLLITMMIKTVTTTAGPRAIMEHLSTKSTGTTLEKYQFFFSYNFVLDKLDLYGLGLALPVIDFPSNVWTQIALYIRCDTYNGKTGLMTGYRNGVLAATRTAGAPTAFFPTDNTIPVTIASNSVANCQIGSIKIMKGLDAAGLDPAVLIAQEYAFASQIWTNP